MPERRVIAGVSFLRPLLDVPKARLTAYLEALGVPYVRDPSNQSDRFLRARVRQLMPALAALGLDANRLADTARRMARADQALAAATAELGQRAACDFGGVVRHPDEAELAAAPDEIVLRLITSRLRAIRPRPVYPPRAEAPERWLTPGGGARRRAGPPWPASCSTDGRAASGSMPKPGDRAAHRDHRRRWLLSLG